MYLPPNNDGAGAFLETLRLMLVHETRGPEGNPRPGARVRDAARVAARAASRIAVHDAPTSFGPVTTRSSERAMSYVST